MTEDFFSCKGFVRVGCIKEETGNPIYWKRLWNPHHYQFFFSGFMLYQFDRLTFSDILFFVVMP